MKPILVFVYDRNGQWLLQNLGNGPALNIVVAEKPNDNSQWINPMRIPPLAREGRVPLRVNINASWLGATYTDIEGHDYYASACSFNNHLFSSKFSRHPSAKHC